jgi:hypothetical protein
MSFDRVDEEGTTTLKWTCNECGSSAEFDGDGFLEAWSWLKARRWAAMKLDHEMWWHWCPKCRRTGKQILDARPK